ncbi:hypothetical protein IRZ71_21040 [Flavobacterium sp. ANB]|uniref:hypothetical protein n=1 Tax=unclassified Flavobacterium TaxID=196869 RepID=UPI0012B6F84B|nr:MULTISPECIES: hypothetical protein [unclassified Flavobacterium]MBF4518850.1 hypothetical protein [Flavobacterium sp. ANB]MTD71437.1 hypothetical protein [Flavobacterium sp. LC2016-13]
MIEKREKRKKIFYVPGMISLIFIPLLCLIYFYKVDAFKVYTLLNVELPAPDNNVFEELNIADLRKYKIFNYNSNEFEENRSLEKLRFSLRKLKKENDTINGIRIHLGKKMTYGVYVQVLNIFAEEGIEIYIPHKDDFWVFMKPKPKQNKSIRIPIIRICGYDGDFWEKQREEAERKYVLSLYRKNWVLFLGYFGLVLLNIFALVKFNKNR